MFPVTKVDPAVDVKPPPHEFHSAQDERIYNLCKPDMSALSYCDSELTPSLVCFATADQPEAMANAPISLQVYGGKNEEEAVLRMAEIIDAALKAAK